MLVVFFDIDGVLNHYGGDNLDSNNISLFNELWAKTKAHFIMTSTWRIDFHNACKAIEEYGGIFPIIGATPMHLYDDSELDKSREAEINHWIQDNVIDKNEFNYVIIDDVEFLESVEHLEHFVHCNYKTGFTEENLNKTIKILLENN